MACAFKSVWISLGLGVDSRERSWTDSSWTGLCWRRGPRGMRGCVKVIRAIHQNPGALEEDCKQLAIRSIYHVNGTEKGPSEESQKTPEQQHQKSSMWISNIQRASIPDSLHQVRPFYYYVSSLSCFKLRRHTCHTEWWRLSRAEDGKKEKTLTLLTSFNYSLLSLKCAWPRRREKLETALVCKIMWLHWNQWTFYCLTITRNITAVNQDPDAV